MLHTPRGVLATALSLIGILVAARGMLEPPDIHIRDAPLYDGNRVTVTGFVDGLRVFPDGQAVATLRDGDHAIEARGQDIPVAGTYVEATGDLRRTAGRLVLWVHDIRPVAVSGGAVTLEALVQDPGGFDTVTIKGQSDGRKLSDGRFAMMTEGLAMPDGGVEVTGSPAYRSACACYRLVVHEVRAWTPS